MSNMFNLATSFNQPLDSWNMKKEMDLSGMFMDASSFNQPLQNWRVEKVRDIGAMFDGASWFNQDLGWCVPDDVRLEDDDEVGWRKKLGGGVRCLVHVKSQGCILAGLNDGYLVSVNLASNDGAAPAHII